MHSFLRAGVALAALATLGDGAGAQSLTFHIGDSVFVGFFVQDQSPHVFRGGATFTVCGAKNLFARFYADAAFTRQLAGTTFAVNVPCVATDTTKLQPLPLDTTKTQPAIAFYPGFPSCAGTVGDSSVHLSYCSPPSAPPLFLRVSNGIGALVIPCKINGVASMCAPVNSCETQNPVLGGSFDRPKPFTCADTIGLFARTNLLSPIIPPN
jgi:hypothetical protein